MPDSPLAERAKDLQAQVKDLENAIEAAHELDQRLLDARDRATIEAVNDRWRARLSALADEWKGRGDEFCRTYRDVESHGGDPSARAGAGQTYWEVAKGVRVLAGGGADGVLVSREEARLITERYGKEQTACTPAEAKTLTDVMGRIAALNAAGEEAGQ